MILGGDFNCVLAKTDCTGHFNFSRVLNALVKGFDLVDMWEATLERGVYTHYTRQGASRLDRIYVTRNLSQKMVGTETVMAAFTDHLAVVLRIALDVETIRRGTGYWKLNVALLQDILSEKTTTTMGTVETAEGTLSRHGDVVREGSKITNPSTLHT
jgi:hypothetical protein